jgi:hypothetical protein
MPAIFRLSLSLSLLISVGVLHAQTTPCGIACMAAMDSPKLQSAAGRPAIAAKEPSTPILPTPGRRADFNADGRTDILWQAPAGDLWVWYMNGTAQTGSASIGGATAWKVVGTGDFNGDGKPDILWQLMPGAGDLWVSYMNGTTQIDAAPINGATTWKVVGTGDFNLDGKPDILWQAPAGDLWIWYMNGATLMGTAQIGGSTTWKVVGTGDFNGDGKPDILWQLMPGAGDLWVWYMNGTTQIGAAPINGATTWKVAGTGDFNGDGKPDILWQLMPGAGDVWVWFMDGAAVTGAAPIGGATAWTASSIYAGEYPSSSGAIMPNPTSQTIVPGGTAQYQLTIRPPAGFNGTMALSATGLPGAASANFSPSTVTGPGSSIFTIGTNGQSTPTGQYSVVVSAKSGGVTEAQTTVTLTVTAPPSVPSSSTVIPFGWVSPAETLMFTANMNSTAAPWYFSVIVENAGTFAASNNVVPAHACYVQYLAPAFGNVLTLGDDNWDGTYWVNPGGTMPGTQGPPIENSQCKLDIERSYVQTVGTVMTVQLALTFKPAWSGPKEIFVDTGDATPNELSWTNRGSWTVPASGLIPVTTDHYDVFRTGANVHETILTPANAATLSVKKALPLDSCAWAQPLYVPDVMIGGALHKEVVFVATSKATIYAYDADGTNTNTLWPARSLGTPPPAQDPNDIWDCTATTKIGGPAGIVGTPTIDLSSNTMYVDGNLLVGGNIQHKLFAIDITTGLDKLPPTTIASAGAVPTAFVPSKQLQRPGLLLADYSVVVPYGSYADGWPYQGWMFSFNRGDLSLLDDWNYGGFLGGATPICYGNNPPPGTGDLPVGGDGIWMSGGGAAFDGTKVYFSTGNNKSSTTGDEIGPVGCSNSLLQVDPHAGPSPGTPGVGFDKIRQFMPAQAPDPSWLGADADLGSSRVILIPGTNHALVGGKAGNIYVVDRTTLDGTTLPIVPPSPFNVAGRSLLNAGPEISGGLAYWNRVIYTWAGGGETTGDSLRSFNLQDMTQHTFSSLIPHGEQGAPISISANFDTNGLIWAVFPNADDASHTFNSTGQLLVFNANDLTRYLPSIPYDLNLDHVLKFTPPMVANGKVFIATGGQPEVNIAPRLLVYGLP